MGGSNSGFAILSPEERKRIASLGGIAAHKKGTAHTWDSYHASIAGRKGGGATHRKNVARKAQRDADAAALLASNPALAPKP